MVDTHKTNCLLVSDFTVDNLAGYLKQSKGVLGECIIAPFGQVSSILHDNNHPCWQNNAEAVMLWTVPETIIPSFKSVLNSKEVALEDIMKEVDAFCALVIKVSKKAKWIFMPTWVIPTYQRGLGFLDVSSPKGLRHILMEMNLRLAKNLSEQSNIFLLPTEDWLKQVGKNAFDPKLWYLGKIPFDQEVFKLAVEDIISALENLNRGSKKLIILDLDHTLWGGIIGDCGYEQLRLGGHDPEGEAYQDFQRSLKSLNNRGILLGIVSKNEEQVAFEAIEKHPEMILKRDDFAGWRINWEDKAQNIVELANELNIGLDAIIFIDDSPVERARVKEALPEVFVIDWPENPLLYNKTLLALSCLDPNAITKEDHQRSKMYTAERLRKGLKTEVSSFDDWLKSLELTVEIEELNKANTPRVIQLINKTNQMNLTTRRLNEEELKSWIDSGNRKLWTFRVKDKFGDYGLVGIISLDVNEREAAIVDFLLSCRVIGRKIEEIMITTAIDYARSLKCSKVTAAYQPTEKNKPCLTFWLKSGFEHDERQKTFTWDITKEYPKPETIEINEAVIQL